MYGIHLNKHLRRICIMWNLEFRSPIFLTNSDENMLNQLVMVEETWVAAENHPPTPGHWQHSHMSQAGFKLAQWWETASSKWQAAPAVYCQITGTCSSSESGPKNIFFIFYFLFGLEILPGPCIQRKLVSSIYNKLLYILDTNFLFFFVFQAFQA